MFHVFMFPMFPQMLKLTDSAFWEHRGLTRLDDIYTGDVLASFADLQRKYYLPKTLFYQYLQLCHALQAQFAIYAPLFSDYPLIGIPRFQGSRA